MITADIVLGCGWGDEGKGNTTAWICSKHINSSECIVVRFSGGQQAGHNVVYNNKSHICQSFGSGVLHGKPTLISSYCTFYLSRLNNEYYVLKEKLGYSPVLFIDSMAHMTTPMDVAWNRANEKLNNHGSVGLGVAATYKRNLETPYKLYACDLMSYFIYLQKYHNIKKYYDDMVSSHPYKDFYYETLEKEESMFIYTGSIFSIVNQADILSSFNHIVFEGSQGILLDMIHGVYPNVTYGNTTSKNAMEMITSISYTVDIDIYYVTRCYQTRHGNGKMSDEKDLTLINCNETNVTSEWQGIFRIGEFDYNLLNYSISVDSIYHKNKNVNKNLVVTCMDQLPSFILDDHKINTDINDIYLVYSPSFDKYKKV